jgi:hypothetical protein
MYFITFSKKNHWISYCCVADIVIKFGRDGRYYTRSKLFCYWWSSVDSNQATLKISSWSHLPPKTDCRLRYSTSWTICKGSKASVVIFQMKKKTEIGFGQTWRCHVTMLTKICLMPLRKPLVMGKYHCSGLQSGLKIRRPNIAPNLLLRLFGKKNYCWENIKTK